MTKPQDDRDRLATALQELRLDTGLSTAAFAKRLGWSQSKVSKTELGRTLPKPDDVVAWVRAADADPARLEELVAIADRVGYQATEVRRALAPGRRRVQEDIRRLEASASAIRVFAPTLIVGLAQTRAYADAVFRLGRRVGPPDESIEEVVQARLARQAVLKDKSLRRKAASPISNVSAGVVPFDADQHAHQYHGFAILGDPERDSDSMVLVPTFTRSIVIRSADEVADYVGHFEVLRSAAVEGERLRALLRGVMAGLADE
jgi:transcriptional regulator with XRE-family HTH domain